jgi:hypothetical protein
MFAAFLSIISISTVIHNDRRFILLQNCKCLEIYCGSESLKIIPSSRVRTPACVDDVEEINFRSKFQRTEFAAKFRKYLFSESNAGIKSTED